MDKLRSKWDRKIEIASQNNENQQRILQQRKLDSQLASPKSAQGRKPRRPHEFTSLAANLWTQRRSPKGRHSSVDLLWMGEQLDSKKFTPVSKYLEETARKNLKVNNSKNSNSKHGGAIRLWADLVRRGDKHDLQAMRKLMSRCAGKIRNNSRIRIFV
jgi:hypothetical protein